MAVPTGFPIASLRSTFTGAAARVATAKSAAITVFWIMYPLSLLKIVARNRREVVASPVDSELILNPAVCSAARREEAVLKVVLIQQVFGAYKEPHGPELAQRQPVASARIYTAQSVEAIRPRRKRIHKIREHRPQVISRIERVE